MFENIECEWPLFLELLLLDALIRGDCSAVTEYRKKLEDVVLRDGEDGIVTVPELYLVPEDKVGQTSFPHSPFPHSPFPHSLCVQVWKEYQEPHSQDRVPGRKRQHMWSQSLYILCGLLQEGLLNIGEIDPLNRRLSMTPQPDPLVQSESSTLHLSTLHSGCPHSILAVHTPCSHLVLHVHTLYYSMFTLHIHTPCSHLVLHVHTLYSMFTLHIHTPCSHLVLLMFTLHVHTLYYSCSHSMCSTVVLLSEDRTMCSLLKKRGVTTETIRRVEIDPSFPVKILPARYLAKLYQQLGIATPTTVHFTSKILTPSSLIGY